MRHMFYLIVLQTSLFVVYCEEVGAWKKGTQFHGYKVPDWLTTVTMPWMGKTRCIVMCSSNSCCTGLFYNVLEERCLHFYVGRFVFWVGSEGDYIVFFERMDVVTVTNGLSPSLDFEAASDTCSSLRGRLITYNEIYELWTNGLEMCSSCGWIDDGTNVRPQQSTCDGNRQLERCGMALAHAFCILN